MLGSISHGKIFKGASFEEVTAEKSVTLEGVSSERMVKLDNQAECGIRVIVFFFLSPHSDGLNVFPLLARVSRFIVSVG